MTASHIFVFGLLERAALEGRRCPTLDEIGRAMHEAGVPGGPSGATSALARDGRIRVEVFGKNYRVVTILTGPNAGKTTAPHSRYTKPYRVIDASTPPPPPVVKRPYFRRCIDCRRTFETPRIAQHVCEKCSTRVIA